MRSHGSKKKSSSRGRVPHRSSSAALEPRARQLFGVQRQAGNRAAAALVELDESTPQPEAKAGEPGQARSDAEANEAPEAAAGEPGGAESDAEAGSEPPIAASGSPATEVEGGNRDERPPPADLSEQAARPVSPVVDDGRTPPTAGPSADQDSPAQASFARRAGRAATQLKKKSPPSVHVGHTKAAALGPPNERMAGAKAAQVGDMNAAPAGAFDKAAFIAAVEAAIAKKSPKTLEQADDLAGSGGMEQIKQEVGSRVEQNAGSAKGAIEQASVASPDAGRGEAKGVTAMPPAPIPTRPGRVGAAGAMPRPKPRSATDLGAEPAAVAGQMQSEGVTEEQLASSEEPEFLAALDAKRAGDAHSKTSPGPVRAEEQQTLAAARAGATQAETAGLGAMTGSRLAADQAVASQKVTSKGKDEKSRQEVANKIEEIHRRTQGDANAILTGLDKLVDSEFGQGEAAARRSFETVHKRDMAAWKEKRYSGVSGALRWASDKIFDPPPEANRIFDRARRLYLDEMRKVIVRVADIVARELTAAKQRIAEGRKEVADYVASLPKSLQSVGAELGEKVQAKFDALDADVDSKQSDLVQVVAGKYTEAKSQVDAKVEELKAANRGLWGAAKAKIGAVIDTIRQLKDAITSALKGAAAAISLIIAKPKRFFDNLTNAIGTGLRNFVGNIGTHLQKGFLGWLTGAVSGAGIAMPDTFDLKGVIDLVLQVLGLTKANIKARIVKKLGPAGEKILGRIESGLGIVAAVFTEGPVALWNLIASKVSNLWDLVIGKLKDFLITKVIMAGVTWLIGLLNPVAGFIKVCKAIVDVVMWFWNNAGRLMELVKTITGSALAIAKGAIGPAAKAVENVLSRALPMVIGFLASLLGVGGLGQKVKEVIGAVRRPVNKVIDGVVGKALRLGRRILNSSVGRKLVGGVKKGIAFGKKKIGQAKAWGEKKVQAVKKRVHGGDDSPEGKQKRLNLAMASAVTAVNKFAGKKVGRLVLDPKLKAIQLRRGIGYLGVKPTGSTWTVEGRVDRAEAPTDAQVDGRQPADPREDSAWRRLVKKWYKRGYPQVRIDYLSDVVRSRKALFKRRSPPNFWSDGALKPFRGANIGHFLRRHTFEFFDFQIKPSNAFWKRGTTIDNMQSKLKRLVLKLRGDGLAGVALSKHPVYVDDYAARVSSQFTSAAQVDEDERRRHDRALEQRLQAKIGPLEAAQSRVTTQKRSEQSRLRLERRKARKSGPNLEPSERIEIESKLREIEAKLARHEARSDQLRGLLHPLRERLEAIKERIALGEGSPAHGPQEHILTQFYPTSAPGMEFLTADELRDIRDADA